MKRKLMIAAASMLVFVGCTTNGGTDANPPKLATLTDTLSWAYGQNFADVLRQDVFSSLDAELVLQAARHSVAGAKQPLTPEETMAALDRLSIMQSRAMMEKNTNIQQRVDEQQAAYFAQLEKTNPNVKKHPSGFYYEVMREGKGPKAKVAQRILFDYRSAVMLTGEPYDQTYGKREPIMHVVGAPMFQGLVDAFQLMNAGSQYRFYFPYQLAFGASGSGDIPGYTPFIYEVELHEIFKD